MDEDTGRHPRSRPYCTVGSGAFRSSASVSHRSSGGLGRRWSTREVVFLLSPPVDAPKTLDHHMTMIIFGPGDGAPNRTGREKWSHSSHDKEQDLTVEHFEEASVCKQLTKLDKKLTQTSRLLRYIALYCVLCTAWHVLPLPSKTKLFLS